jgi:cytochrome c1
MSLFSRKQLVSAEEAATLNALQERWQKWSSRLEHYHPDRACEACQDARRRFIEDPSETNEAELIRYADEVLVAKQYRAVREACTQALKVMAVTVRNVAAPILERVIERQQALLKKAEAEEAKVRASVEKQGMMFDRSPKSETRNLELAIANTRSELRELNDGSIRSQPVQWLNTARRWQEYVSQ